MNILFHRRDKLKEHERLLVGYGAYNMFHGIGAPAEHNLEIRKCGRVDAAKVDIFKKWRLQGIEQGVCEDAEGVEGDEEEEKHPH